MIKRVLSSSIEKKLGAGKAIIILGPRQVGKTTLLKTLAEKQDNYLFLNGDDPSVQQQLEGANTQQLKQIIGKHKLVFVDEAQRIKNIGLTLKLITDQFKKVQLLVSGSSALEIASEINEPLTGRKWEHQMYPVSWQELHAHYGHITAHAQLEQRLIYGMYPDVITHQGEEREVLQQLAGSYLYKDLLSMSGIRKPELLDKLLRALALQLGNEVSYNELSGMLQVDKNTINNYIQLLEKAFVIFRLQPFSRNVRNEITSSRKIYFYDNGIRNAIIANFNSLAMRQDTGALWENFMVSERMKFMHYKNNAVNTFFWRTSTQQEIDYLEERDGKLFAYEFKWNKKASAKFPKTFSVNYPKAKLQMVTSGNFEEFINK
jgi:predicted AAA+ superfamily ATPase